MSRIIVPGDASVIDLPGVLDSRRDLVLALHQLQREPGGCMPRDVTVHEPHASFKFVSHDLLGMGKIHTIVGLECDDEIAIGIQTSVY
jgi:hypothetical protein